ncbi:MAG: hypothetical protein ACO1RT_13105 [Planctomycetaceae bacterium]
MRRPVVWAICSVLGFALSGAPLQAQPQPLQGQPQRAIQRPPKIRSAEQWVRQLESELDHLEEDLRYERGAYPSGIAVQIDQASRAAAHFRQVLRRNESHSHVMRDFEEMDRAVHQLVRRLEESNDRWLRRQAARIRYPDEQLHYVLQRAGADRPSPNNELLKRHAHVLENEAFSLQELVERVAHPNDPMRDAIREFADVAEHFHHVVERGSDDRHLINDFRSVDDQWQQVVNLINRSSYGLYLRRNAQNVNRVHNQIHDLLASHHGLNPDGRPVTPPPPVQPVPTRPRPSIEFEIPGIGRFSIPR